MSGKRGKGEGSVHKLPSGSWQSQIMDGYTDEGKRHIVSFTAPTRAEALSKLREYMLNKQTQAEEAVPEIPLFADYAQQWYESYRTQVEESTYANYRYTLKLLNGVFGHLALNEVNLIGMTRERNTQIRNSVRTDHLDNEQRCALFKLLEDPSHLYELFIVSLYYSGLDAAEIAALRFDDFEVLTFRTGCCYTLLVSQRIRKLHQRYSTVSAINEQFPIEKFRRVVLAPWAGEVLVRWLDQLRTLGFSDDEIRQMRLSDETPNGAITGPAEIAARLQPLVKQAGVGDIKVIRTGKNGCSYRETLTLDIQLLGQDARYLAMRCGADTMMLHAMFGGCFTETDEQSYADLLSDSYAIARYLRLRRWSPYSSAPLLNDNKTAIPGFADMPTRYILQVHNSTNHPCTLTLSAPYAIVAKWKSKGVLS